MEALINTAQKFIVVKDITTAINFDIIKEEFDKLDFTDNINNLISVQKDFFDKSYLQGAKQTIVKECEKYLNSSFGIEPFYTGLKMTTSWANKSLAGTGHHDHVHPFSIVSGVLFLDNNVDNLNLNIEGHVPEIPYFITKNRSYVSLKDLLKDININPEEHNNLQNHIVLFMSNCHHYVKPSSSESEIRRTISFNTFWQGVTGWHEDTLGSINFN